MAILAKIKENDVLRCNFSTISDVFSEIICTFAPLIPVCGVIKTRRKVKLKVTRIRQRSEENGRALHNVKASSMLCLLDNWNLRNSNCVPKTMSEVNATGMTHSYPGVCSEGRLYPHAHFSRKIRAKYRRRQTLFSLTCKGNSQGLERRREEMEAYVFCVL